jgi:4-diphosphocytidyl-2C-methyl-D-erythritol kinase
MLRETLCCFLILTLVGFDRPVLAGEQTVQEVKSTVLKADIEGSKAKVRLKDGRQLTGRISGSGPESFTLTASSQPLTVSYADVEQIKQKRWSAWYTVLIVVGAILGSAALACASGCAT